MVFILHFAYITCMIDEKGQIAVDFLLGISLFLIALMFIVQFIPGLFLPGSANEGSLDHTAYRTATVLTEDPGWWGDSITSNTVWEENVSDVKRIGLAVDDDSSTKLTNSPNLISKNKTLAIMRPGEINETVLVEKLGLYDNINDKLLFYGYNISITKDTSDSEPFILDTVPLARGATIPKDRDATKITRIVLLETGKVAYFDAQDLTTNTMHSEKSNLQVTGPLSENVTIMLSNFNISSSNSTFLNMTLDGTVVSASNLSIYKKAGKTYSPFSGGDQLKSEDILYLDLNQSLFSGNQTYLLELRFKDVHFVMLGDTLEYTARVEPFYEQAYISVVVWK